MTDTPIKTDPRIARSKPGTGYAYALKRIRVRIHLYHSIAVIVALLVLGLRLIWHFLDREELAHSGIWYVYEAIVVLWLLFVTILQGTLLTSDAYRWVAALRKRMEEDDRVKALLNRTATPRAYVGHVGTSTETDLASKFGARAFPQSRIWPVRRRRLFGEWLSARPDCVRWILSGEVVIGYTCILPLTEETQHEMERGHLTWYEVRSEDLVTDAVHLKCIYVQAICIDEVFNRHADHVDVAIASFIDHVSEMLADPRTPSRVEIVAEATTRNTREFLKDVGYDRISIESESEFEHEVGPPFDLFKKSLGVGGRSTELGWLWRAVNQRVSLIRSAGSP
jgi:hypothetical protein